VVGASARVDRPPWVGVGHKQTLGGFSRRLSVSSKQWHGTIIRIGALHDWAGGDEHMRRRRRRRLDSIGAAFKGWTFGDLPPPKFLALTR